MANTKKKSSASTKRVKRIEKDIEELELDEDLDDELLEDSEFDLDDELDDELKELEVLSSDERIIRVEKRVSILMWLQIITLAFIILTLCVTINYGVKKGSSETEKPKETENNTQSEDYNYSIDGFKEISFSEIASASKNKEIIVVLGRQGCYWCSLYIPTIGIVAEDNNFDVYYLDFGKMVDFTKENPSLIDADAYNGMYDWILASDFKDEVSQGVGTPLTFFVKNNKIVNMIGGYVEEATLNTYLKKEGFIK